MLEVCIDSLESALNAIHGGTDELEVCSSLPEGGLTPSPGLVKEILAAVENVSSLTLSHKLCTENCSCIKLSKRPKVNIMIRCRTGSDFCYSHLEMETMLSDLETYKAMNVDRFVFGSLTKHQSIDFENCTKIIERAKPIPVTFHRAFDIAKDPLRSVEGIIKIGFDRILTSGQQPCAVNEKAVSLIKKIIETYGNKIQIMPGAGINSINVVPLVDIGCKIFHGSCKKMRKLETVHNNLTMGTVEVEFISITDKISVSELKQAISVKLK